MRKLSEIVAPMIADWRARRANRKFQNRRRHWQAGATFGAVVQLGYVTRKQALRALAEISSEPVLYIDDEHAFIAFGSRPVAR